MKTVAKGLWPAWVRKQLKGKTGIELKENNGYYYVYSITSHWDKEKGKPVKTTKYNGTLTKAGVSTPRNEFVIGGIHEYGNIKFVIHLMHENGVYELLKQTFPNEWKYILGFALNRLMHPKAMKSIRYWIEKTCLQKDLGIVFQPKKISENLQKVGLNSVARQLFFDLLMKRGDIVMYDGSVIFSNAQNITKRESGYNKEHVHDPKLNIVLGFSHKSFQPVYLRILPGSVRDVSTVKTLIPSLPKQSILVTDKGFYSWPLFEELKSQNIGFIIPLRRDDLNIDYSKKLKDFFVYRKRPIKYASYSCGKFFIYMFEDISLKADEERTYYLLKNEGKKVSFNSDWAGKISLISTLDRTPKYMYELWKSREDVEKAFDVFQNTLETDTPYVHLDSVMEGYMFASFVSLIVYYLVLAEIKRKDLNNKYSVGDVLIEFSKVYLVETKKREFVAEIPKRVRKLAKALDIENLFTKKGES